MYRKTDSINMDSAVIMWNKNLIGDIQVNSYKDFLNPELKKENRSSDPAKQNGVRTIADMAWIYNDHEWEGEAGWNFVTDFIKQLDGRWQPARAMLTECERRREYGDDLLMEGAAFCLFEG